MRSRRTAFATIDAIAGVASALPVSLSSERYSRITSSRPLSSPSSAANASVSGTRPGPSGGSQGIFTSRGALPAGGRAAVTTGCCAARGGPGVSHGMRMSRDDASGCGADIGRDAAARERAFGRTRRRRRWRRPALRAGARGGGAGRGRLRGAGRAVDGRGAAADVDDDVAPDDDAVGRAGEHDGRPAQPRRA